MRPTLRQLQYIVAVAESGRFRDAATQLGVSQPSLSEQISDAEAQLGVTLIERARTGAVLTPAGVEIVRRARIILTHVEDLKTVARQSAGDLAGALQAGNLADDWPLSVAERSAGASPAVPGSQDGRPGRTDDRP